MTTVPTFTVMRGPWPATLDDALLTCITANLQWLSSTDEPLSAEAALANLKDQCPYVWLAVRHSSGKPAEILAATSLNPVAFGQASQLHGISAQWYRNGPDEKLWQQAIAAVTLAALECAFTELRCTAVNAAVESSNPGAKGFCWRWGFKRLSSSQRGASATLQHYQCRYAHYLAALRPNLYRSLTAS